MWGWGGGSWDMVVTILLYNECLWGGQLEDLFLADGEHSCI